MVADSSDCCALQASIQRKAPPRDIAASVVLVVAGCLIAGLGDFTFDLKGCGCPEFLAMSAHVILSAYLTAGCR